ncbi:WxL domain-containing protein [Enterococcus faecalis]|uniref:WxL domain-containing protein n=1 Tax=Enterococcus faecalis TaxID=1351 RepID=UPI000353EC12|nr:WxL domain-containing protein [Enterococcus faecalis]EGO2733963.1 WxL domain-containing protein [Enterococcus faecalis]EGO6639250.1 WxL domain-containing protein [Enterococcus faecalis]EGO8298766.1 WxL domain-containing protein [Enterococcus faecalis]EGO8333119.1 WxL domain-containing protein [Enterococcus faecalis]EGO8755539.1 WxL domain-containing protein [Enterococcus faecalis]
MKQNKWQRLAAIGLCGSLLVNAFSGVTAVAETVTIESSPTAESSVKEETQANSETQTTSEATTETSQEEVTQETEKQAEVVAEKKEAPPVKAEQEEAEAQQETQPTPQLPVEIQNRAIGVKAGNLETVQQQISSLLSFKSFTIANSIAMPAGKMGLNLVTDDKTLVNLEDFSLTANITTLLTSRTATSAQVTKRPASVSTSSTGFDLLMDATGTMSLNVAMRRIYLDDVTLKVPKYIENVVLDGDIVGTGSNTSSEWAVIGKSTATKLNDTSYELGNYSDAPAIYNVSRLNSMYHYLNYMGNPASSDVVFVMQNLPKSDYTLTLTNRKVTENFKDVNGTAIPAPTGFTQGQQTSITSNDFTYTSAKALPDIYTAGGKAYKFKGWYKGTDKTALKTTKTPSYAVTYDDQDDMTAVYEDLGEATTLPAQTFKFSFVDEQGNLVNPSGISLKGKIQEYVTDETPKIIGEITGKDNGMVKEYTIPEKVFYGVTDTRFSFYGAKNSVFTIPKYYKSLAKSPGTYYSKTAKVYPVASIRRKNFITNVLDPEASNDLTYQDLFALTDPTQFLLAEARYNVSPTNTRFTALGMAYRSSTSGFVVISNDDDPTYYYLENRRVTENFVDATGAKITPPTGFTQGNKVVIDSENFTYTSAKALPATYTVGDKNYKFKGWYKGTDQTALKTTKTPSYAVTYDDKDDMTAIYEEVQETTVHPGFYAEFVDEQGKAFTNPLTLSGNYTEFLRKNATSPFEATGSLYPMAGSKEATVANRYKVETKQNVLIPNNYELLPDPATGVLNRGFALNNFGITNELKYVDKVEATTKTITLYDYDTISDIGTNLLSDAATTSLNSFETTLNKETNNTFSVKAKWGQSGLSRDILPNLLFLTSANSKPRLFGFDGTSDYKQTINYKITRKQVTENFVDATGAKITPPTGFTQGKQIPMTSNSFTYTSANALPDTYTAGDKSYKFKGWYKGIDKTALETTKTPSYAVTYDDKDDMTAVYEEVQPTAEMTVSRLLEVIPNGSSMVWTVRLKNTSEVPLTNIKLAPTAKWAAGISAPTQLAVRIGSTSKIIPVTAEQWRTGVNLGVEIPVNGEALVTVNTAKITGEPRQLLTAEMTASGNFSAVTASNFVRIQGEDQTITPAPVEEGFISTPTFDFGKITISSSAKQYGLKKAADYYGNGTRNPYLRIKKSQPNWQLTAQLSQLKASTDSLPTSTRLLLGNADVAAIENYNQVTESTNKVGVTKALTLTSDGTSTPVVLNNQFTGNDVYQLDFDFASVKLDVPANQGKINEKYQGTVTWNLVTGP